MAQITGKINLDISGVVNGISDANKIVNKFKTNIDSISDVDVNFKTDGLENSNKDVETFAENVKNLPKEKKVEIKAETDTQSTKEFIKQLDNIVLQKKQALIQSDLELKNQLRSNALLNERKLNEVELYGLQKKQLASSNEIKNTIEETYKITKNKGIIEFGVNIDEKTKDKVLNQLQNIEVDIKFNQAAIDKAEASIKEISDLKQIELDFDKSSIDKLASEISGIANKVDVKVDTDYDSVGKAKNEIKSLPNKSDVTINADVSKVQTQIDKLKESLKGLGGDAGGGLIDTFKEGGVLGIGIAAATAGITALTSAIGDFISGGFELNSAFLDLENRTKQFGFNVDELKNGAKEAFVGGVGGSVAEAAQIIGKAAVTLKGVFDPKELTTFVIGAQALGKAYDKDVNEVIQKSEPFIKQFGLSGKEAFDLLSLSLRDAGTAQDDVLDSLAEYSQLAVQAGFSAEGFVNALTVGAKEGVFNTDKIADALKETQIRLKAGDIQKTFKDFANTVPKGLLNSIKSTEELARSGQISIKEFLRSSADGIEKAFQAGEISESIRTQLQIAISGTPAEDLGSDIYTKVFAAPLDTKAIQQKAAEAGQLITNTTGQYTSFEAISKQFTAGFEVLSAEFIKFADKFLSPVIGTILNSLEGLFNEIKPVIDRIITALKPFAEYFINNVNQAIVLVVGTVKAVLTPVFNLLVTIFDKVVGALKPIIDIFKNVIDSSNELSSNLSGDFLDVLNEIGALITDIGKIIIEFLVTPFEILSTIVTSVINLFKSNNKELKETGKESEKAGGFLESLKNIFQTIRNVINGTINAFVAIKTVIGDFVKALSNLDVSGALSALTGFGDKVGKAYKDGFDKAKKETEKGSEEVKKEFSASFDDISKIANKLAIDFKVGKINKDDLNEVKRTLRADIDKGVQLGTLSESQAKQLNAQLKAIGEITDKISEAKVNASDLAAEEISNYKSNLEIQKKQLNTKLQDIALQEKRKLNDEDEQKLLLKDLQNSELLFKKYKEVYKVKEDADGVLQIGLKFEDKKAKQSVLETLYGLQEQANTIRLKIGIDVEKEIAELIEQEIKQNATKIKELQDAGKTQLTIEYGINVGREKFANDISALKSNIQSEIANIRGLLLSANDKQKIELNKNLTVLLDSFEAINIQSNELISRLNLEYITDRYEREKAISLFELDKKYKEEIAKIGENEARKNEIYLDYINKKREIDKKYNAESLGLYDTVVSNFITGFVDSFNNLKIELPTVDVKKVDETKNKIAELQNQLDGLSKSDGELLSYEQFKENEQQIKKEIASLTLELETETKKQAGLFEALGKAIQLSFENTFKVISENSKKTFEQSLKEYQNNAANIIAIKENQTQIETDLQNAYNEGRLNDAEELYDKLITSEKVLTQSNEEQVKLVEAAYTQMAISVAGSFAQLAATGKATLGDFLLTALDALDSLVPILVAQITGVQLASPNPANALTFGAAGVASALALTALFKGLVAFAKSGIRGAEGGVIDLDSSYNQKPGRTDTIPFMLAKGESVLTAKQTKEHKEFLEHISNGGNERTYFVKKFKDSLKFDNISDMKLAKSIKNVNGGVSTNILTFDNKNIEKGLNVLASLTKETNNKLNKLDNLERQTLIKGYNNHTINVNKKIVNEIKNNNYIG